MPIVPTRLANNHVGSLRGLESANESPDFYADPSNFFKSIGAGQPGHVPMPEFVTPESVRSQRNHRVASIFKNHRILRNILVRHELTIQKRWTKKPREQKRRILLTAWGTKMAENHRPDFDAYRKLGPRISEPQAASKYRSDFMWPFINQEDLTKPKALLLFLNARGRNSPSDFAGADYEAMHLGVVSFAIGRVFLNEHVMLFTGRHDESDYAELLNWDEHPDAFDWLHSGRHMHPGEGLLILEAQDRVYSFLVNCARQILHDIPEAELREYPAVPEPSSLLEQHGNQASLATLAAEAPYRVPKHLDFARIESLLAAQRDESADHLWSMREDPSYFGDLMIESSQHKQEMVLDNKAMQHPCFRLGREELFWGRTINSEVVRAALQVEMWASLYEYAAALKSLQQKYAAVIRPEDDLPEEYLYSLLRFRDTLEKMATAPKEVLEISFIASPPWRAYFERTPSDDPTSVVTAVRSNPNKTIPSTAENLLHLVRTLWEDGNELFLCRMTNVMDELQRYIDTEPEVNKLVTPYVARQISNLSVIGECLRQLDNYQPWANMYNELMLDRKERIEADFRELQKRWMPMYSAMKGNDGILARYGTPTEKRFYYPIEKRRNKNNTEAMRQAEQNLDDFWHKVDELMHRNAGSLQGTSTRELFLQPRLLQRTPAWIKSESGVDQTVISVESLVKPLSEIYFDLEQQTERTTISNEQQAPRVKHKTRGTATVTTDPEGEAAFEDSVPPPPQPVLEVDARSLKVFKTLFYTPSSGANPGEVPWVDFLHAMCSTGFQAEKLYGSAWNFRPAGMDIHVPINIHEPHPASKIPYRIARRLGKRLSQRYGWSSAMFVLAKKGA